MCEGLSGESRRACSLLTILVTCEARVATNCDRYARVTVLSGATDVWMEGMETNGVWLSSLEGSASTTQDDHT
jgi:hypothetical protein